MTLSQENIVKTTGLAIFAHSVSDFGGPTTVIPLGGPSKQDVPALQTSLLRNVIEGIQTQLSLGEYQASGAADGSLNCTYSGNMRAALSWEGPDNVSSYCEIVDLSGSITMNSCELEQGVVADGQIDFNFDGPFCQPTRMIFTLTNYTYSESGIRIQSRGLTTQIEDLVWSGSLPYGSFTSSTNIMSGQAVGTIDGVSLAAAFDGYIEYFDQLGSNQYSISVGGHITGPCLDGWAELGTSTPVIVNEDQECPSDGEIYVYQDGGTPIPVIFNSNGSVQANGVTYGSCEDMNTSCAIP